MADSDRGPYDTLKDAGRKPVEMLSFFGVKSGMSVLDVLTGSGYSAELLSAAVGPQGTVYAQNSFLILRLIGGEHHDGMMTRIKGDRLPNVRYIIVEPQDMPFDESLDFAMWGLNMHDEYHGRGEDSVLKVLRNIRRALKPNGILAISDHVGIPGQDNAKLHRIEPASAKALIEKAGFVIEANSSLLANPDDDHTTNSLRRRFTLQNRPILDPCAKTVIAIANNAFANRRLPSRNRITGRASGTDQLQRRPTK